MKNNDGDVNIARMDERIKNTDERIKNIERIVVEVKTLLAENYVTKDQLQAELSPLKETSNKVQSIIWLILAAVIVAGLSLIIRK